MDPDLLERVELALAEAKSIRRRAGMNVKQLAVVRDAMRASLDDDNVNADHHTQEGQDGAQSRTMEDP